jgi:exodeoxyribonuclease-3
MDFYKHLLEHLATALCHNDVLIVGGDFNVAPTDLDVYDSQKWTGHVPCSDKERAAFEALLSLGMIDAFASWPSLQSSAPHFTWWDYRFRSFNSANGLRIDHFLLSSQALAQSQGGDVLIPYRISARPSDHAPIRWKVG